MVTPKPTTLYPLLLTWYEISQPDDVVVREDVVDVPQLEGRARGPADQDQEQSDDRQPELGGPGGEECVSIILIISIKALGSIPVR